MVTKAENHPIKFILTGDGKTFYLVRKVGHLRAIVRADRKDMKKIEARDIIEGLKGRRA